MFDYKCVGLDVFLICQGIPKLPERVGQFKLEMISQRGMRVWPGPVPEGVIVDWFRCRFMAEDIAEESIAKLLAELTRYGHWEKVQKLWQKDGQNLFSGAYES
jgi:hypothetical protein